MSCRLCGNKTTEHRVGEKTLYDCDICGKYILSEDFIYGLNGYKDKYSSEIISQFLFYNKSENRCIFLGDGTAFSKYLKSNPDSTAKPYSYEEILNWYPKNFNEKIEKILCKINDLSKFDGDYVDVDKFKNELFFCKKIDEKNDRNSQQIQYILDYLIDEKYVEQSGTSIRILPKGFSLISQYYKNETNKSKSVFVAMKFGTDTKQIREAIRRGVEKAGYIADFIDEKIYNDQIVPTIFEYIGKSRFLISDTSYPNNGAYYEAGYALGLGKQVIFTCSHDKFNSDEKNERPHFDISQRQMLIWDNEEDLTEKLFQWIKALNL